MHCSATTFPSSGRGLGFLSRSCRINNRDGVGVQHRVFEVTNGEDLLVDWLVVRVVDHAFNISRLVPSSRCRLTCCVAKFFRRSPLVFGKRANTMHGFHSTTAFLTGPDIQFVLCIGHSTLVFRVWPSCEKEHHFSPKHSHQNLTSRSGPSSSWPLCPQFHHPSSFPYFACTISSTVVAGTAA